MRFALLGAAALLVATAGRGFFRSAFREAPPDGTPASDVAGAPPPPPASGAAPAEPPYASRPRSLRRTRVDGGLEVDAAGHFIPTIDARRLFDYFLSASGEMRPEALRTLIVDEIARRLPPDAAAEATALLDRYLAYRQRVRTLADQGDDGDLEGRLAMLGSLRRETLGAEIADLFFADEEAAVRTLLETRRIVDDPTLAPEERARRVDAAWAALDADLPPETREARARARLAGNLRRMEDEVRASGGGPEDVQALRERLAGPEAAARLADLDRRRADWSARVDAFRAARAGIAGDGTLGSAERAAAIERLLVESFTPAERLRVRALDRIAASAAPAP